MDASVALVTEHNAKLQSDFEQGLLSAEAVLTAVQPVPVRIRYPTPSWIRWWKSSWGWPLLSRGGDEQGWLPYSHPDMAAARLDTKRLFSEDGCHKWLCLNYDQIWRNAFTLQKTRLLWKDRSSAGKKSSKKKMRARGDKKVHAIRGARRSITVACLMYCKTTILVTKTAKGTQHPC